MKRETKEKILNRMKYLIAFLVLILLECYIAIYVHDTFIRPYIGDMLVVIVIYCFAKFIILDKCKKLPFYIFLFAFAIEVLQYFQLVEWLGLEKNRLMRIIIGSVYDIKDIICYGIGCSILAGYEFCMRKYKMNH